MKRMYVKICTEDRPALCAGFIPIPSLVMIALVAGGTLN